MKLNMQFFACFACVLGALLMLDSAAAACPIACSGHGTCDVDSKCTCSLEGKALYSNSDSDSTAGWQRGDGGEAETRTESYRRAVLMVTVAAAQSLDSNGWVTTGSAGFVLGFDTGFDIVDGGRGYMIGAPTDSHGRTCSTGNSKADYIAKGCPSIAILGVGGGTTGAVHCQASDGVIIDVKCFQ